MRIPNRGALHPGPWILAAALILAAVPADAQIVNSLGGWDDDEPGWSGAIGAIGSLKGGNTDVRSGSGAARVQWNASPYRVRLLGSFSVEDAEGVRVEEESLAHLRVNRELGGIWGVFAFAQVQRNPFQRLETRWLIGAGPYAELTWDPHWTLRVGASPMFESERIQDEPGSSERGRLSTFVRASYVAQDRAEIDVVGFYQPRFSEPSDYRSSVTASLAIDVVGELDFLTVAGWEHDDVPPAGVEEEDWSLEFGLRFSL